ncbi:MAG: acetyl-CoA carboxylase biotin carboxyl carrier protein [Phycisphaerales bacterium JB038]
MIDNRRLKELIRMMVDNDLTELDISDGTESVTLRRQGEVQYAAAPVAAPVMSPGQMVTPAPAAAAPAPAAEEAAAPADADEGLIAVTSPMVGTFYSQPKPEEPPFVVVGSDVRPDSVVCLVEAMKVFKEIQAETAGVVEKVLVNNGEPVEFGQKLLLIRPK